MKLFHSISASILLAGALAAPTPDPSLISSIIASITSTITSDLNSLLSALGISYQNNGASHGSTWNWHSLSFPKVSVSPNRFSHTLNWPCNLNFVDWTTFKANGANLGIR